MKLKALRPQTGSYGSVDAGGVVDVIDTHAEALLKTGNWATATAADEKAALAKQERFVAEGAAFPVGPRFGHTGKTLADPLVATAVEAATEAPQNADATVLVTAPDDTAGADAGVDPVAVNGTDDQTDKASTDKAPAAPAKSGDPSKSTRRAEPKGDQK